MPDRPLGFFEGTEMPTAGWWEALWPEPAGVLRTVGIKSDMDVIDLCSGDGWFTLQIAKIARHVVAIDIDADLLKVARKRLDESGSTNSAQLSLAVHTSSTSFGPLLSISYLWQTLSRAVSGANSTRIDLLA